MRYISAGRTSVWALLLSTVSASWPSYNLHNSQHTKRHSPEEPEFNEEYDFIIAGGMLKQSTPRLGIDNS